MRRRRPKEITRRINRILEDKGLTHEDIADSIPPSRSSVTAVINLHWRSKIVEKAIIEFTGVDLSEYYETHKTRRSIENEQNQNI